jgi:DNA invertase Pin-like site-specific DNA recombinase
MSANKPSAPATGPVTGSPSPKVTDRHLSRLAVVYIRQSTLRQVRENAESTARQYDLPRRAIALGWSRDRILVVDDDLGRSGREAATRPGFQRLLAEVGLDHVGLILGLEMSRLARSCRDWHQLLALCGVFHTLLADPDGVYDPTDHNDRLLLGLTGIMSEAELHVMRNRLDQGKRNKASRGELFTGLPAGYVRLPGGGAGLDPDEQVREAIQMAFDLFAELGSGRAVAAHMRENGVRLPLRRADGTHPGALSWREPSARVLYNMYANPTYAGAYVYGRHAVEPRRREAGSGRHARCVRPMDQWPVALRDRLPAYVTWDQYLANRARLHQSASRWDTRGAPRDGSAILPGLAYCERCGLRMFVHYPGPNRAVYRCPRPERRAAGDASRCPEVPVAVADAVVARQVLRALEPAALELSLRAHADIERDRQRVHADWDRRLERARYEAERAKRQYNAVEPENRLVGRELERRWEQALAGVRQLEEEYDRFQRDRPRVLTAADRDAIRRLAGDLPGLWSAASTTPADRQVIVRQLVEQVRVGVPDGAEHVQLAVRWVGGSTTAHVTRRGVRRYTQLADYAALRSSLIQWREAGQTAAAIARRLNAANAPTARGVGGYTAGGVRVLLCRLGLTHPAAPRGLGADEYAVSALAHRLGVSVNGVKGWVARGWAHGRREGGVWVVWADADELSRLGRIRDARCPPYPPSLTTPKPRPRATPSKGNEPPRNKRRGSEAQ